jgi:hypothetical protein
LGEGFKGIPKGNPNRATGVFNPMVGNRYDMLADTRSTMIRTVTISLTNGTIVKGYAHGIGTRTTRYNTPKGLVGGLRPLDGNIGGTTTATDLCPFYKGAEGSTPNFYRNLGGFNGLLNTHNKLLGSQPHTRHLPFYGPHRLFPYAKAQARIGRTLWMPKENKSGPPCAAKKRTVRLRLALSTFDPTFDIR